MIRRHMPKTLSCHLSCKVSGLRARRRKKDVYELEAYIPLLLGIQQIIKNSKK